MDSLPKLCTRAFGLALGVLTLAVLATTAIPAHATTIDFSGLEITGGSYIEKNFELSSNGFWFLKGERAGGDVYMFVGATVQINTLKPLAATVFDLISMDLSELNDHVGPQTIEFTGTLLGGGTVSQTFTTDGPWGFQTFTFGPEFQGLTKLTWDQMNPESFMSYDNIVLQEGAVSVRPSAWTGIKRLYGR